VFLSATTLIKLLHTQAKDDIIIAGIYLNVNIMNRKIALIIIIILIIASVGAVIFFSKKTDQLTEPERTKVAATIFPLYDITKNIAGDKLDVKLILPPGASPHTFEAKPQDIKNLQNTKVIFAIGHNLDNWTTEIVSAIEEAELYIVDSEIDLIEFNHENDHEHKNVDPHYWLSVENAKVIVENIYEKVKEIDPENSRIYKSNYKNYLNELSNADLEIKKNLADLKTKKMVTFHNAWQYFAKDYGLKIVKTFEPFPGKQPTAKYLLDLEQSIKKNDIEIIFSEPQLSVESLQAFLNDMDLELFVLDPLGGTGPDTNSYIKTMKKNAEVISEALDYESD